MDLNRLAVFARVVAEGSFTSAARALDLPKSSVSRSVALLEHELGTRLLQRSTRKLRLTEAGGQYYERVARALADIGDANALAAEMQSTPRGTVRVTAPTDLGAKYVVPLISKFLRNNPAIQVDLSLTGRVVDLRGEGFDLAVRAGTVRDESLVARKVGVIDTGLFASRKYVERRGIPASVDELAHHDCILFQASHGRGTWTLIGTDADQWRELSIAGRLSVDDLSAVRKAVIAGAGIGLLPAFFCAREVERGIVVRALATFSGAQAAVHVVYPSAQLVPQRVALLRDFLMEGLARIPWSCGGVAAKDRR